MQIKHRLNKNGEEGEYSSLITTADWTNGALDEKGCPALCFSLFIRLNPVEVLQRVEQVQGQ
jgi:hypothetical protein